MAIKTRQDLLGVHTRIETEHILAASRLVSGITGFPVQPNKAIVGANAFAHESGIHQDGVLKHRETYEIMTPESVGRSATDMVMGKHSGRHAVKSKVEAMGFRLSDAEVDVVAAAVKRLADIKKKIYDEDVEAIVLEEVFRIPDKYRLKHLHIQSGTISVPPTAAVIMEVDGQERKLATFGVGPVDAVFNAIADIIGKRPTLEQYLVNAITDGTDAQGEVTVKIEHGGLRAVGRGSDADIIVASAKAMLNALNRLEKKSEDK
jgi:2-isopropylmalate synthase